MTENTFVRFFSWWKQGLVQPWRKILFDAGSPSTVLSVVASDLVDSYGNTLNQDDIDRLKNRGGIYLLAPSRKVMSIGISDSQKGLPLSRIAEELLPFDASELFFASDAKQDNIHAIVGSELAPQISVLETHGLGLSGVVFTNGAEPLLSDRFDQPPVASQSAVDAKLSKFWLISVLTISTVFVAIVAFLSHLEKQRQALLSDELEQLQQQLAVMQVANNGSATGQQGPLISQIEIRDSAAIISTLRVVANSLTDSTQLDQLILSDDELVIDASAASASKVQANLDGSAAFESSEFITSISRSNSDASERFRLKAKLKGGQ